MHADLPTLGHRHFCNLCHHTAKAAMDRNTARALCAVGRRLRSLLPVREFCRAMQHTQVALVGAQQLRAKRDRILSAGGGAFIDEAFGEECVLRMRYRAPNACGHRRLQGHMRYSGIRKRVGGVGRTVGRGVQEGRRAHAGAGGSSLPGKQLAVLIQACRATCQIRWAVVVVRDVLLARPQQLYGRARGFARKQRGLHHEVGQVAPAEAAAEIRYPDLDFRGGNAQRLGHRCVCEAGGLRRRPDGRGTVLELHGAIHRLHGRVGEKGNVVLGLHYFGSGFQARCRIAPREMNLALLSIEGMREFGENRGAG